MDDDQYTDVVVPRPDTAMSEYAAGPNRLIVVYEPPDTGAELDPGTTFRAVAADAARRSHDGQTLQSIAVMPLRHAGLMLSIAGSGVESKAAIVVVYARA